MKIRIKFMSEQATETIKKNLQVVYEKIKNNPINNKWIYLYLPSKPFEEKVFEINDFTLEYDENYQNVAYKNAITIYENLKHLPRRILADERFWLWIYFEKFYKAAVGAIKVDNISVIRNHWLFTQGNRRGLAFGVLSREFFRVELTIDESLDDKYELTKYIFEKIERFRNLTWRTYSNNKRIVLATLKAQKDFEKNNNIILKNEYYPLIAKRISRYASVNFLDMMDDTEIYNLVYNYIKELIE